MGICHRDLKPENILFDSIEMKRIKIIDFGLSNLYTYSNSNSGSENNKELLKTDCGSPGYAPPEMIFGMKYDGLMTDIWSCGIILYIMLCGKPPFYSQDEEELKKKICSMKYNFDYPEFKRVSQDAINLIKKILVGPDKRLSASEILADPWIKENAPNATGENLKQNWEHIEKYSKLNLVQKSIINFTAFHLTSRETKEFVELFKSLDENSDGVLSIDEIKKGVEQSKFGTKGDNIVKIFEEMDIDKNGLVNYTEFISALMDYEKIKENQLLECFNSYDTDDSGKISFKEFCDMIKPETEEEKQDLKDLYDQFDTDGDGEISLKEFKEGFKKRN